MSWLKYFRDFILDRGHDYYTDGAVENYRKKNGVITAIVSGTDDYKVEIKHDGDFIVEMSCTCPYAEDGNYCKHMAAVLFKTEEYGFDNDKPDTESNTLSAKEVVSNANEKKIREFLIQVLENNPEMLFRFSCFINRAISEDELINLKHKVDAIITRCSLESFNFSYGYSYDDDDHEEYQFYTGAIKALINFLHDDVRMLLDNQCYHDAFELTCYLHKKASELDFDEFGDGISPVADECYGIWQEIIEKSDVDAKREYFERFLSFIDEDCIYVFECFEHVIMGDFFEDEFIQKKLEYINEKINEAENMFDTEEHIQDYSGDWALLHLQISEEQGAEWASTADYCKRYWESSNIRDYYVNKCVEQENYEEAIRVLEENIERSSGSGWLAHYIRRLKNLYLLVGNEEKYREQLWKLVLEYDRGSLELYKELKSRYSADEWEVKRETILSQNQTGHYFNHYIENYLVEEKLYDRLLEAVCNQSEIYALDRHFETLKGIYPNEILQRYRDEVETSALRTSSRSVYQNLVSTLRKMKTIPGGEEAVREIVLHWQMQYSNRRAMMDELRRL